MLKRSTGSLTMTGNLFRILWITASNIIHELCLAIIKHLASNSVWSVSFRVLRSYSFQKPSYLLHSSFSNTVYSAYLSPLKYLPLNSSKALTFLKLLIKSSTVVNINGNSWFFSSTLHLSMYVCMHVCMYGFSYLLSVL